MLRPLWVAFVKVDSFKAQKSDTGLAG